MRAGRESEPTESGVAAARRWRKIVAGEVAGESVADFEVVFVCTGNRFRSPLAAGLFTLATAGLPVTVRSAGTLDIGPRRAFPETLEEAHRFGLDLSRHSARAIAELETSAADLAVGFEQVHLAVAVMSSLVARERAFTLPELVELLEHDVGVRPASATLPEQARLAVERAAATRAATGRKPGRPELADPVGRSRDTFTQTADEISDLVNRLVHELFG